MPRAPRTAVIVAVPAAEPVVGEWRLRHTGDVPLGMPPHVTLLVPFVPPAQLTRDVEERLAGVIASEPAFDAVFARAERFPGVLYLAPEPPEPFARLTHALVQEWPEHPPYEGAVDTVIPHLTVAESADWSLLDRIAAELEPRLPVAQHVSEAQLYVEDDDGRWHERRSFPLASS
jgi:2'-5' RNA ligase